jgi:hypothetical protein
VGLVRGRSGAQDRTGASRCRSARSGAAGTAPERFPGLLSGFHVEGDPSGATAACCTAGRAGRRRPTSSRRTPIPAGRSTCRPSAAAGGGPGPDRRAAARARPRGAARPAALDDRPPAARHHFFYAGFDLTGSPAGTARCGWPGRARTAAPPGRHGLDAPFRSLVRELGHELPLPDVGVATALDALVLEATRLLRTSGGHALLGTVHPRSHGPERCWTAATRSTGPCPSWPGGGSVHRPPGGDLLARGGRAPLPLPGRAPGAARGRAAAGHRPPDHGHRTGARLRVELALLPGVQVARTRAARDFRRAARSAGQ